MVQNESRKRNRNERFVKNKVIDILVDREKYLSKGVHIGMRAKYKDMEPYIYRVKKNKLAIIDLEKTDERIKQTAQFLSKFDPEDILLVSRKEEGWKPIVKFAELTGAKRIYDRFMPGILTNPNSDKFMEPKAIVVTDPVEDEQAVREAVDAKIPIVAICDSANRLEYIDLVIPGNNKGKKSLGLIYYLLTREYLKNVGEIDEDGEFDFDVEEFTEE